jgi:3-phenylpropionate/trans-cinnamate dioxygenase ferredoxin reductase subunit
MSNLHVKYLLIGGGPASGAAAVAIRANDREGDVLLIGQEINRPYDRRALVISYLADKSGHDALFTLPADWFAANNVQLRTGRRGAHLDVPRMAVTLDDGKQVSYDKLLIATGATPGRLTIPGADLPSVYYLRTFEDADRLRAAIDKARNEGRKHDLGRGRAVIVGAGLQGVELAGALTKLGIAVEITTGLAHVWGRFAGESTAGHVARVMRSHGVGVNANVHPVRFEGDGRVQRVALDDGRTLDADFVVVAMGLVPTKDILRGTAIAAERAILVDERAQTNIPHVYAAGDCAAFFDPLFGKHRLSDHWDSAALIGTIAGKNMAGVDTPLNEVTTFASDVFGMPLNGFGEPRFVHHRLVRGQVGSPDGFLEIGIASDGRVSQVLCVGTTAIPDGAVDLVANRVDVTGREEHLKDPDAPLPVM